MPDNLSGTDTPRIPSTGIKEVDQIIDWMRKHYDDIADVAESKGIPRPPHW